MHEAKIFLSYARKDGEAFATALRQRLQRDHPELPLWQDRAEMEGGVGWWIQIEEALDRVEFLVIVMTPRALASEIARKEWRYARQRGVIVYPVKGVPDAELEFGSVPNWMRKAHWYDLGRLGTDGTLANGPEWETFIRHLQGHPERRCVPFMAPDKPEWFVDRPREFNALLGLLLDPKRENPVGITTALQGAGGYGKTTLATVLCHEDRVIEAFDDGILWATLGQTPNPLSELTKLYEALTREQRAFVDVHQAAVKLGEKLEGRNCLLVVDDVWKRADLEPFLRGGKGCARLVTTRRLDVAAEVSWIKVDEMGAAGSVELLTKGLSATPADLEPIGKLARRLGEWPLLLRLVNGTLRAQLGFGANIERAVRFVNQAIGEEGVTAFDAADSDRREDAVARTVGAGLRGLKPDDRQRLYELAVFPQDTDVPLATLGQLWGLGSVMTQQTVQTFANLALFDLNLHQGSIRVHDVMRLYLAKRLRDPVPVHRRLVAAWGDLHKPPDAYAWGWVAYHLVGGRRDDELRRLLLDFDWLQAKLDATGLVALIADYEYLKEDQNLELVRRTIRISAHALERDRTQLASQILGRLDGEDAPDIQRLVRRAATWRGASWLRPLNANLHAPGTALIRTFAGHAGFIRALALSPDGRFACSGSDDRTLKVWDLESGKEVRTLAGHAGGVWAVALSADGLRLVSGSDDQALKVWDIESGRELRTLRGHGDGVVAVALSTDGQRAVSGSWDGTLKVWDLKDGRELRTLVGHAAGIRAVALSGDGWRVVSGSYDRTLKVWDLESGRELRTLQGHAREVMTVAVSAAARRVVSGSEDQTLKVWDLESGRELRTLQGHGAGVVAVALSADGQRVVSGSWDRTLKVWDLASGRLMRTLQGHGAGVVAVALSADGKLAVSGSHDQTLRAWDLESGRRLPTLNGHFGWVGSVALSMDGRWAVSGSEDRTLKVWDGRSGRELGTLRGHAGPVSSVALSADGGRAVSGSWDQTLKVWDLERGQDLQTLQGHAGQVWAVALSADGRRAVSGSYDQTVRVWDLESWRELQALEGHGASINTVALSADGRRAVSASAEPMIKVWDLENWREQRTLRSHGDRIEAVALSADGRRLVSVCEDDTIEIWDLESGRNLRVLQSHGKGATSLALTLSAAGRQVVCGFRDHSLTVWDLESGTVLAAFTGESAIHGVGLAADARTVVAGEESGRVHFLRLVLPDDSVAMSDTPDQRAGKGERSARSGVRRRKERSPSTVQRNFPRASKRHVRDTVVSKRKPQKQPAT